MGNQQQTAVRLRLANEYAEIKDQLARMRAELKQTGLELVAEGQKLIDSPEHSFLDAGSLSAAALNTEKMVDRYRMLMTQKEDKGTELNSFSGIFERVQQCKTA